MLPIPIFPSITESLFHSWGTFSAIQRAAQPHLGGNIDLIL